MIKIKLYHRKTLLWTYLVWAILNLLFNIGAITHMHASLAFLPLDLAWFHIVPLGFLLPSSIDAFGKGPAILTILSVLVFIAGLLINRWWGRFLVIIGMSLWFMLGLLALSTSA